MGKFKKNRTYYKIDSLPKKIKNEVDKMLSDKLITYTDVKRFIKESGQEISISAISRYALNRNKTLDKIIQAQEQIKTILEVVKKNKEFDYTEAGLQIMVAELTKKIAESTSDIENMSIIEATKLLNNLARTKSLKGKAENEIKNKKELALECFEEEILKGIAQDEELGKEFYILLEKIKGKNL